jgi:TatD DNase family protein
MLVDSHCHLDFEDFSDRLPQVLDAMAAAGVGHALCISVTLQAFPGVLALAEAHSNLFASVGVHPDYPDVGAVTEDELVRLANHPRIVAIGETGLDYYRLTGDLEWQRERFRTHIRAARRARKPLVIHTRAAAADTLAIMREEGADAVGGVMHCFTETLEVARAAVEMGFCISFSGIVTFKSAQPLREVAQALPLDRILVETDAPYLAPVPFRGKTNEPAFVRHVAAAVAGLRKLDPEAFAAATTANFFRTFAAAKIR